MVFVLIGFIIAFSFFLYFLSAVDSGKRGLEKLFNQDVEIENNSDKEITENKPGISQLTEEEKNYIPKRTCPVCNMELKKDEPLYAHFSDINGKKKILIYGCQHCHRDSKE